MKASDKPPVWFWIVFLGAWFAVMFGPIVLAVSGAFPDVGQESGRFKDGQ